MHTGAESARGVTEKSFPHLESILCRSVMRACAFWECGRDLGDGPFWAEYRLLTPPPLSFEREKEEALGLPRGGRLRLRLGFEKRRVAEGVVALSRTGCMARKLYERPISGATGDLKPPSLSAISILPLRIKRPKTLYLNPIAALL